MSQPFLQSPVLAMFGEGVVKHGGAQDLSLSLMEAAPKPSFVAPGQE